MADILSPADRSALMSRIKGKDTKPELIVRKNLHKKGFRYRLNGAGLRGRPDLVLPKHKAVIFVHGCFWHAHDCHLHRLPSTRPDFWLSKLAGNRVRDADALTELHEDGWRTCIVWECALRGKTRIGPDRVTGLITTWLSSSVKHTEIRGAS